MNLTSSRMRVFDVSYIICFQKCNVDKSQNVKRAYMSMLRFLRWRRCLWVYAFFRILFFWKHFPCQLHIFDLLWQDGWNIVEYLMKMCLKGQLSKGIERGLQRADKLEQVGILRWQKGSGWHRCLFMSFQSKLWTVISFQF